MTLNAYFLEKPTCRRESWLTKSTYPQNIQRTSATLVNKRSRGARLPGRASVEKWDQTACKPGSVPPAAAKRRALAIIPLDRPSRDGSRDLPGPLGPTTALPFLRRAHGPYSVLLLAGLAMPSLLPGTRWALTPPFHPYPGRVRGGLLSVALSLGSPPAGVTRRHVEVEPGLSSTFLRRPRSPGRLVRAESGRWAGSGQARG